VTQQDTDAKQQDAGHSIRLVSRDGAPSPKNGRVAITAFGLPWAEAQRALDAITKNKQFRKRELILVLTDVQPSWIASSPHRVELLPTGNTLAELSSTERQHWIESRWSILKAKWDIQSEVALGQSFHEFSNSQ
jgi:hypothetical protein